MPGPQQEIITIKWLQEHSAHEHKDWFYLHGYSQGSQVSFGFQRDAFQTDEIRSWALMGHKEDRIWLPTIGIGNLQIQRVSLARFYTIVMALGLQMEL